MLSMSQEGNLLRRKQSFAKLDILRKCETTKITYGTNTALAKGMVTLSNQTLRQIPKKSKNGNRTKKNDTKLKKL